MTSTTVISTLSARRLIARAAALLAALTVSFAGLALASTPATAHSELVSSKPAEGASVANFTEVSLTFGDEITPEFSSYTLTDQMGMPISLGTPAYDSTKTVVTIPLASLVGGGAYVIGYSVLSIDGHTISGTINFTSTAPGMGGHNMNDMDADHTAMPMDADHSLPPHPGEDHDHDSDSLGSSNLTGLWYALIGAGVGAIVVALITVLAKRRRAKPVADAKSAEDAHAQAAQPSADAPAQDKPAQDKPSRRKPSQKRD